LEKTMDLQKIGILGFLDAFNGAEGLCCINSHGDALSVFLRCEAQENQGKVSSPQLERV